jgi:hypothetical protein
MLVDVDDVCKVPADERPALLHRAWDRVLRARSGSRARVRTHARKAPENYPPFIASAIDPLGHSGRLLPLVPPDSRASPMPRGSSVGPVRFRQRGPSGPIAVQSPARGDRTSTPRRSCAKCRSSWQSPLPARPTPPGFALHVAVGCHRAVASPPMHAAWHRQARSAPLLGWRLRKIERCPRAGCGCLGVAMKGGQLLRRQRVHRWFVGAGCRWLRVVVVHLGHCRTSRR